ncbi:hypothetical protein Lal_00031764 [Lupinus albus]|nr:hypothetical protein Lal_00031764 [Lupinus albus]
MSSKMRRESLRSGETPINFLGETLSPSLGRDPLAQVRITQYFPALKSFTTLRKGKIYPLRVSKLKSKRNPNFWRNRKGIKTVKFH